MNNQTRTNCNLAVKNVKSDSVDLSILICSILSRAQSLANLLKTIEYQITNFPNVEVLVDLDNKIVSIGAKRNRLIQKANGKYIVFVDDDDLISNDYVESLLNIIVNQSSSLSTINNDNETIIPIDCITFLVKLESHYGLNHEKSFANLVKYSCYYENSYDAKNEIFLRKINHIMCLRKSLASQILYDDVSYMEDTPYAEKLTSLIKREVQIDKVLYFYLDRNNTNDSAASQISFNSLQNNNGMLVHGIRWKMYYAPVTCNINQLLSNEMVAQSVAVDVTNRVFRNLSMIWDQLVWLKKEPFGYCASLNLICGDLFPNQTKQLYFLMHNEAESNKNNNVINDNNISVSQKTYYKLIWKISESQMCQWNQLLWFDPLKNHKQALFNLPEIKTIAEPLLQIRLSYPDIIHEPVIYYHDQLNSNCLKIIQHIFYHAEIRLYLFLFTKQIPLKKLALLSSDRPLLSLDHPLTTNRKEKCRDTTNLICIDSINHCSEIAEWITMTNMLKKNKSLSDNSEQKSDSSEHKSDSSEHKSDSSEHKSDSSEPIFVLFFCRYNEKIYDELKSMKSIVNLRFIDKCCIVQL